MPTIRWDKEHITDVALHLSDTRDKDIIEGDPRYSEAKRLIRVGTAHDYYGKFVK